MKKNKVLVILGQTTTGKSSLAVKLAKKFNGEIISADSRQVYKKLNIGTGKIIKRERGGIPHHLLDVISPQKRFSVVQYKKLTEKKIKDVLERNKLPIICGGAGFYIQAIVDNIIYPQVPPNQKLREKFKEKSGEELLKILKKLDLKRFKTIDQKNKRRIVRAIEIVKSLGKTPDLVINQLNYEFLQIGLKRDNQKLKEKIKERLLKRLGVGMIAEAKKLHHPPIGKKLSWKRMEELGLEYKYLAIYLQNKLNKKEMIEQLNKAIWHYAKRQKTWFKKDKRINWFNPDKSEEKQRINRLINNFLLN